MYINQENMNLLLWPAQGSLIIYANMKEICDKVFSNNYFTILKVYLDYFQLRTLCMSVCLHEYISAVSGEARGVGSP